jgi:hypothetical protein
VRLLGLHIDSGWESGVGRREERAERAERAEKGQREQREESGKRERMEGMERRDRRRKFTTQLPHSHLWSTRGGQVSLAQAGGGTRFELLAQQELLVQGGALSADDLRARPQFQGSDGRHVEDVQSLWRAGEGGSKPSSECLLCWKWEKFDVRTKDPIPRGLLQNPTPQWGFC